MIASQAPAINATLDDKASKTLIVGEPQHDIINVRRLVSPMCNDAYCFLRDHEDMIHRLSAPLLGTAPSAPDGVFAGLGDDAMDLLRRLVEEPVEVTELSHLIL